ncbi:hypothetical protein M501DRAFT_730540 [Patellaria atrata CBS 101060]|uniref:CAP-Gly domain-containing protein n=1 Tax=Patellaria atrata CBS 101060 TaxID=1346257 RepID=A0A9P4SC30_9PEZI|nr:hypothetical protein M501DRAFT_730540 [Patellaria atrata CBS 101060]
MTEGYKLGQLVELNDGRQAIIRFVGETSFAAGLWIGVEFEEQCGKNDGSVQGERYFNCPMGHGMFLKPTGVGRIMEQPKPPAAKSNGKPVVPPSSAAVRKSTSRPASIAAAPRSTSSPTGRSSPGKKPAPTTSATTRNRQSLAAAPSKRMSMGPPSTTSSTNASNRLSRPSLGGPSLGASRAVAAPSGSPTRGITARRSSIVPTNAATKRTPSAVSAASQKSPSPPVSTARSIASTMSKGQTTSNKEVEELQTKLKVMEKKRIEDRDKLKTLEKIQQERDRFEGIIQKLQSKYQPQQQENHELKMALKEAEARLEEIEVMQAEHDSIMEMATLDREMAEEQTEVLKAELENLRVRMEELELENEILEDENKELNTEMSPEERTNKGWLQMERENERLREALLRLRDITQESEAEMKHHIKQLEGEVQDYGNIKEQYDDTKAKLLETEADIEDLRQQLDAALGAEEMIEELTDKNLSLNERIEELRAEVDDLSSLKELNDELELNHVEHEKQLQEFIDQKDSVIAEFARRTAQNDEALVDQEYTISRFRELVTNLQADLEDLRASKEISETEAQELASRSKAMMEMNRQLQSSAAHSKIKTIDMELRKLEAQEAAEHLAIVQLFLPEAFQSERDSILALLRFKRIAFKSNLLHGFIKERVSGRDTSGRTEDVFEACDVLDKLTWVFAMCDRFINSISSCPLERFSKFESALHELDPVERALNTYVEGLKKDEIKEDRVAEELQRSVAVMTHLGEYLIEDTDESFADTTIMRTLLIQSYLETSTAALTLVKVAVLTKVSASEDSDDDEDLVRFNSRADAMVSQIRSTKVIIGKTVRALQELKARSLTLVQETSESFEECESAAEEIAEYTRQLGKDVYSLFHEEGRTQPFTFTEVQSVMYKTSSNHFDVTESDIFSTLSSKLNRLMPDVSDIQTATSALDMTVEFERPTPPWVLRSRELQASKIISIDAQEEMERLREDIHRRAMELKLKNQSLEEANVKIELLESRTKDSAKKLAKIKELEQMMGHVKAEEQGLKQRLEKKSMELEIMEQEKNKWQRMADERKTVANLSGQNQASVIASASTAKELASLRADVKLLESTTRFLRRFAQRESAQKSSSRTWLQEPLLPAQPGALEAFTMGEEPQGKGSREILRDLTNLPDVASPVTLGKQEVEGRLKWRPKRTTPQYQLSLLEERKERWWDNVGETKRALVIVE